MLSSSDISRDVKTRGPFSRDSEQSVRPASSAARMASAVGADAEAIVENPATIAFCTISNEHRLVRRQNPPAELKAPRSPAPMSLSSVLCRPTSSRTATIEPSSLAHAAAWAPRVDLLKRLPVQKLLEAGRDSASAFGNGAAGTRIAGRRTSREGPELRPETAARIAGTQRLANAIDAAEKR